MSSFWNRSGERLLGLAVICLFVTIITVPLLWAFGYALLQSVGLIGYRSGGFTWRHWQLALTSGELASSLAWSLYVAVSSVALSAAAAVTAVLLRPSFWDRRWPIFLLGIGIAAPVAVNAINVHNLASGGGLLSRFAWHCGLIASPGDFPEWVNDRYGVGMIAALTLGMVPVLILYYSRLWTSLRGDRICLTAEFLGASPTRAKLTVMLPTLLRRAKGLLLLLVMLSLGSYEVPLLLGRQTPEMISVMIRRQSGLYDWNERPLAFALASVYFLIGVAILAVYRPGRRVDG